MNTTFELLTTVGKFAVGIWPVMFVVVLAGIFKRKHGFGAGLRTSVKALAITWGIFAILRAVFVFFKFGDETLVTPTFHLVPQAIDAKIFLMVGLLLFPLVFAMVLEERRKRFVVKSIEDMQSLSASEFENLVADSYREQGHQVDVVGSSGDHGIDLIVHTRKGETWLVQCKKYRGKVGEPVIRDFYGALRASEASAGAIVTTGQITEQARLWAEGKPIHLYDGLEFWKVIESTRLRKSLPVEATRNLKTGNTPVAPFRNVMRPAMESIYATSTPVKTAEVTYSDTGILPDKAPFMDLSSAPDCPICGVPMVINSTKRFLLKPKKMYICANAPVCRETHPVE